MKEGPFEGTSGASPSMPSKSSRPFCCKIPKNLKFG